jgi:hypothetical protein
MARPLRPALVVLLGGCVRAGAVDYEPLARVPLRAPLGVPEQVDLPVLGEGEARVPVVLHNTSPGPLRLLDAQVVGDLAIEVEAGSLGLMEPGGARTLTLVVRPGLAGAQPGVLILRTSEGARVVPLRLPEEAGGDTAGRGASAGAAVGSEGAAAAVGGSAGAPIVLGALDKSLIDAEVKRHIGDIRACYEVELARRRGLSGQVVMKFVVDRDGGVAKADPKTTTFPAGRVEACLREVFLDMRFPEPKGGGVVIVSYPFIFQPG